MTLRLGPPLDRRARGRRVRGVAAALLGLVLLSSCTWTGADPPSATRVLQSVSIEVDSRGDIAALTGTAVFRDDRTGTSTSAETAYVPSDVVDELPVRITTQYRTSETAGSDLTDLAGYSGRVTIDLTLENLTVGPASVAYDAAGHAREAVALVGTPLSIAGSTTLAGVDATAVRFDPNDRRATNGVVSTASDGRVVVQWATILAPPQSGASATFHLVADVEDFVVPTFDIAVEAGLQTDLTFEGAIASALTRRSETELESQRRVIALVADVNDVLARAGTTITEVRENLDETSAALGLRAAEHLAGSATALTDEMTRVGEQMTALEADLSGALNGVRSRLDAQLAGVVGSMKAMLGETRGVVPPSLSFAGQGCSAVIQAGRSDGTVFSTLLVLAAQLDGYSAATAGCRDEIAAALRETLGPDIPTGDSCASALSATCALLRAEQTASATFADLVENAHGIAGTIDTAHVASAIDLRWGLDSRLGEIAAALQVLATSVEDFAAWTDLIDAVAAAETGMSGLADAHEIAVRQIRDFEGDGQPSVIGTYEDVAEALCELGGGIPGDVDALHARLVGTRCDGVMQTTDPERSLVARARENLDAWKSVRDALDPDAGSGSALTRIRAALDGLDVLIADVTAGRAVEEASVFSLQDLVSRGRSDLDGLGEVLGTIQTDHAALSDRIVSDVTAAAGSADAAVSQAVEDQIAAVGTSAEAARHDVVESYARIVDSSSTTAQTLIRDGRAQIDAQQEGVRGAQSAASATLDRHTVDALGRIGESTSASTRDVEAAARLLGEDLAKVIMDLGDPTVDGAGVLGAVAASAAKSDTADYQLALASQRATGYANVRLEDVEAIMLRRAQLDAALATAAALPAFGLTVPAGATVQTIYSFHLGGESS